MSCFRGDDTVKRFFALLGTLVVGGDVAACSSSSTPPVLHALATHGQGARVSHVGGPPTPTYTIIYTFKGGSDGSAPKAQLVNVNGTLFGTTTSGGGNFDGTVYSITAGGAEKVLYRFGSKSKDGELPLGGLIDFNGALFGATNESTNAPTDCGAIYRVTTTGVESVKYLFKNAPDGCRPIGQLVKLNTEM